jgi:hypothetical protein
MPALPWKSFASPESDKEYTATEMGQTKFVWGRRRDRPSHRIGVRSRSASESGRHAALQWDLFLDRSIYLLIFLDPDPTGGFTVWPVRR